MGDDPKFILLSSNSYHSVMAFGTPSGDPFDDEEIAEDNKERAEKAKPMLDWLVLEIHERPF